MPLKSDSFDCVSMFHLVEHLHFDELSKTISETFRVLKYGGKLVIATPPPERIWDDASHTRPYTFKAIRQLLENSEYFGRKWKFSIEKETLRVRSNDFLRGGFYKTGLFGIYKVLLPILDFLGLGFKEQVVVARVIKK